MILTILAFKSNIVTKYEVFTCLKKIFNFLYTLAFKTVISQLNMKCLLIFFVDSINRKKEKKSENFDL